MVYGVGQGGSREGGAQQAHPDAQGQVSAQRVQPLALDLLGESARSSCCTSPTRVEEVEHFDPYKVLNVKVGADAAAVRRRIALSLRYHPDKNPDPEAHKFFTRSICPGVQDPDGRGRRAPTSESTATPTVNRPPSSTSLSLSGCSARTGPVPIVLITLVTLFIVGPLFLAVITIAVEQVLGLQRRAAPDAVLLPRRAQAQHGSE